MKYLVISDTHLTDRLERRKFNFLMNLIKPFENIIINGDFWESRYVNTKKFLNSKYTPLFDALKSKNTTYVYGNHDPEQFAKEVAQRVSNNQTSRLNLKSGKNKFNIEHGHRFMCQNNDKLENPTVMRLIDSFGSGILERFFYPLTVKLIGLKWNKQTIQKIHEDNSISQDEIVVCGHTHVPVFDLKNRFIDIGSIRANRANYLILDDGKIEVKKERY